MADDQPTASDDQVSHGASRGSDAEFCSHWSGAEEGQGHNLHNHKPAGTSVFVRQCSWCGWIDGQDLEAQRVSAVVAGFTDAIASLRDLSSVKPWLDQRKTWQLHPALDYADYLATLAVRPLGHDEAP